MFYTVTCTDIAAARILYYGPNKPITKTPERAIEILAEEIRDYARLVRDHYGYEAEQQRRICMGMVRMLGYFNASASDRARHLLGLITNRDWNVVNACADAWV
jgi:hypothetical protein